MEASTLEWLLTLLMFHIVAFAGVIALFRGAPCWIQKVAVALLIGAFAFFCAAYFAAVFAVEKWYYILLIGGVLEHLAVVVYVFRVHWQGNHGNDDRATAEVR